MKKYTSVSLLYTFLFGFFTFAQQEPPHGDTDKIPEIVIDLLDDKGVSPIQVAKYNALKKGQFFRLKIDNVNTYLYDVSVANEDIDTAVELPGSLLDLVDFGGIKSALGNLNSVSKVVRKFVGLEPNVSLRAFDVDKAQTAEKLRSEFTVVRSELKGYFAFVSAQGNDIDAIFTEAENFQNAMTTVELNALSKVPSKAGIKTMLASFSTTKTAVIEDREMIAEAYARFVKIAETNSTTIEGNKGLKASTAEIKKVYEALLKASDNLLAQLSAENYGKFSDVLIGVMNNLDFSYTSLPIQRYSDVNELVISLKPRDKNAKLSGYSTVLRLPDIEKSFWGVSTGFFLTGNPEKNYSIVERVENEQTLYDFLEEDTADYELGINTMIRYGRRVGEVFDTPTFWHFGFGAGLSIDEMFKPRLMAGTGLAFGGKNKVIIDVGAIHMYYNTLSKAYTPAGNTALPENFLVNATKTQSYISLGYVISL
ncbi:MAG: hypothetical protein WBG48_16540 [Pricia sp.]